MADARRAAELDGSEDVTRLRERTAAFQVVERNSRRGEWRSLRSDYRGRQ
ncbi:MAG: hypothetical protein V5A13_01195 [Haloarculaceae archaeon]